MLTFLKPSTRHFIRGHTNSHSSRLKIPTTQFRKTHFRLYSMKVVPVPVLSDNYAYLLIDESSKTCAAIDPVEPEKIIKAAKKEGVKIETILTTHHHSDHAGGNTEMLSLLPNIKIYGGDKRVSSVHNLVTDGDTIEIGSIKVDVFFTPCHTKGHVLYYAQDKENTPSLFTGDTLFIGGCGRFFEGSADQMHYALNKVIKSLPKETLIYCGHEYTVSNLKFALKVEPENQDVQNKLKWAQKQRENHLYTIPSTIGEEETFNPFMRTHMPQLRKNLNLVNATDEEVMAELRELKNKF